VPPTSLHSIAGDGERDGWSCRSIDCGVSHGELERRLLDTGTVTFTDANGKTVKVNVNGGQTSYFANLSSLADGIVTSSLAVNADTAGNTFTPVSGTSATLTQLDNWTNTAGGNWTTASSWSTWNGTHAVPTSTIDADFEASGATSSAYTVNINSADTAYALLLNDAPCDGFG
jgi:hypothetical protein